MLFASRNLSVTATGLSCLCRCRFRYGFQGSRCMPFIAANLTGRPKSDRLNECRAFGSSANSSSNANFSPDSSERAGIVRPRPDPFWMSRVKIPWVQALTMRRATEKAASEESLAATVGDKPEATAGNASPVDATAKRMKDTKYKTLLSLAKDPWLLDLYLNSSGHLRLGAILMDLDALGGMIAYKHTGDSVMTVTAAVDRITIEHPLKTICDLEYSGQVTYATGRSSMEVSIQVAKAPEEGEETKPEDVLITCAFTMVSLDPITKKPVNVAPLVLENEEERQIFARGESNYRAKRELRARSLLEETPNEEESGHIHRMWKKEVSWSNPHIPAVRPASVVHMKDTILRTVQIMQPPFRNLHNFMVFGGYLLQQTFELAFCCAASFSKTRPTFLSLDPSTFDNPVPVGSILYLKAVVSYTDPPLNTQAGESGTREFTKVQVRVESTVCDKPGGPRKPTGSFHYTFLVKSDYQVMPQSYNDFMVWVDAKRRARNTNASLLEGIMETNSLDMIQDTVTE